MSVVSIRLSDELLSEVDNRAQILHLPRTEYIRRAIERMNDEIYHDERKKQLAEASLRVRKNSMHINQEFSDIEDDSEF